MVLRHDPLDDRRGPSIPLAGTLQNYELRTVSLHEHIAGHYPVRMLRKPVHTALAAGRRSGDSGGLVTLIKLGACTQLS
jgi:hypothetical protein